MRRGDIDILEDFQYQLSICKETCKLRVLAGSCVAMNYTDIE